MSASNTATGCELCARERELTKHHLIPRTCHSNKWFRKNYSREQMLQTVALCRDCHSAIHRFVPSEKLLGREFNTLAKIGAHPEVAKFVAWVRRR